MIQAQQSAYGETIPDSLVSRSVALHVSSAIKYRCLDPDTQCFPPLSAQDTVHNENVKRQKRKKNEIDYTGASTTQVDIGDEDFDLDLIPGLESIPGRGEGSDKPNKRQRGNHGKNNNQKGERKPKPISSVFVTGLPVDVDADEIVDVFKKGGVLMEDESGNVGPPLFKTHAPLLLSR